MDTKRVPSVGLERGPEEERDLKLTLKTGLTAGIRTGAMAGTLKVDLRIVNLMERVINDWQVIVD